MTEEEAQRLLENMRAGGIDKIKAANEAETSPNEGTGVRGAVADVVESVWPFTGMPERIEENRPAGGYSGMQRQGLGAAKGFTFAQMGNIGAAGEEVAARIRGTDQEDFSDRRARYNEAINEEAGGLGEFVGAVAGLPGRVGIASAQGMQKGLNKAVPALGALLMTRGLRGVGARAAGAGLLGGAETLAYSLSEGNKFDAATADALWGVAGGAAFQPAGEFLGLATGVIANQLGIHKDKVAAEKIVKLMRARYGDEFIDETFNIAKLDINKVIEMSQKNADDPIFKAFPRGLIKTVKGLSHTKDADYIERMKLNSMPEFRQAVNEVVSEGITRSPAYMESAAKKIRGDLQPQYNAVFAKVPRKANQNIIGLAPREIEEAMIKGFTGGKRLKGPAEQAALKRLLQNIPNRTFTDAAGRTRQETIGPEDLLRRRMTLR